MTRLLLIAATCAALFATPVAAAPDYQVVANSILRVYSDYCEPLYFTKHRPAGAGVDADLVRSYTRVLLTRDGSNCDRFFTNEVMAAVLVPDLLADVPSLSETKQRTLSQRQVLLLGMMKRFDDLTSGGCSGVEGEEAMSILRRAVKPWWSALGRDDTLDFAQGYAGAEQFGRHYLGVPNTRPIANVCSLRQGVISVISLTALGIAELAGVVGPNANAVPPQAADPEPVDAAPTADPRSDYIWEPGDPGTDRGNTDEPIDLTPYVAASDVAAISQFAGLWGSSAACDQGHTVLIGQFSVGDGYPEFGKGVPRISSEHLSCEAGQWTVTGAISTFSAVCHVDDGPAWVGTGTIRWVSDKAVQLFVLDEPEAIRLERCDQQPFAISATSDQQQVPLDIFGN